MFKEAWHHRTGEFFFKWPTHTYQQQPRYKTENRFLYTRAFGIKNKGFWALAAADALET